ncbi:hypothetical protein HD554DRAFT_2012577, partial [Boletus coccyginus]
YGIIICFIWNHYKEAMELVCTLSTELVILKTKLNLTDNNFLCFLAEECAYLLFLKQLPQQDETKICYVQVLDDLEKKTLTSVLEGDSNVIRMALNQACIRIELAYTKLQNTKALATHLQGKLSLELGWQVSDEEYNHFKEDAALAKY